MEEIVKDFKKLDYNEDFGYEGEISISFFEKDINVDLIVNVVKHLYFFENR